MNVIHYIVLCIKDVLSHNGFSLAQFSRRGVVVVCGGTTAWRFLGDDG